MSLDKQIETLSHLHPLRSQTLTYLFFEQIKADNGCPNHVALDYVNYALSSTQPEPFDKWHSRYMQSKRRVVADMVHHYIDNAEDLPSERVRV